MKKILIMLAVAVVAMVGCKKEPSPTPEPSHTIVKVDGQAATADADGWKDYYKCSECDSLYEDAQGKVVIKDIEAWKAEGGRGNLPGVFVKHQKDCEAGVAGHLPFFKAHDSAGDKYYEDSNKTVEISDIAVWKKEGGRGYTFFSEDSTSYVYGGVTYPLASLKDGNIWFAQNLSFMPVGYTTACNSLTNVAGGVYYPVVVNGTTAAFSEADSSIVARGYLYQTEVALGVALNSIKSQADAEALSGAQGICPPGWHIPTIDEIVGLVGKAVSPIATKTDAPYYNGTNGSIALLNADGANMDAYGAVTVLDNTKTTATLMGALKNYSDKTTSGYFVGSSFAGITMDGTSVKNVQFYGLLPMTNKATEAEYTCNGSKLSYKIAASVRCVLNKYE